ncbi:hypothetical protein SEEA0100_11327 [Salmonella enterica subsp. enterica serovar Anatum str. USDA 100]|nr:hypothetical protein SEEA0100_11327 [Salmonella enterica subsp. enterica serovar Anatum str. USDA 100]
MNVIAILEFLRQIPLTLAPFYGAFRPILFFVFLFWVFDFFRRLFFFFCLFFCFFFFFFPFFFSRILVFYFLSVVVFFVFSNRSFGP